VILLQTPFLTVIVADIEKINEEGCPKVCQACKTSVNFSPNQVSQGWEHLFWAPGVWGGSDEHGREAHHLGGGGRQEVGCVGQSHDHV
jgi:hypothetical protein